MTRWVFTILSALSLLLFVAVVVLWVRSVWHYDFVGYQLESDDWKFPLPSQRDFAVAGNSGGWSKQWVLGSGDGTCIIYAATQTWPPGRAVFGHRGEGWIRYFGLSHVAMMIDDLKPTELHLGFGYERAWIDGQVWKVAVPHWFLATLTAPLPLIWFFRRHRHLRRTRHLLCPACGYDLRATPGRCPECGRVPAAPPPPTSQWNVQ